MLSPSCGMMISVAMLPRGGCSVTVLMLTLLIRRQFLRGRNDVARFRQKKFFQGRTKRDRRVGRSDTENRSVQPIEAFFCQERGDFGADAAGLVVFVQH